MIELKHIITLFAFKNRQLLMLAFFGAVLCLAAPSPAHALAIDFSDITSQWASIYTFVMFAASAICVVMIVMTVMKLIGQDWGQAIIYAAGAALAGFVVAHASGWISSETGVTL